MIEKIQNEIFVDDLKNIAKDVSKMKMENNTVFITGGTGLIGSIMIKGIMIANELYQTNIKVIALVRNLKKAEDLYLDFMNDNLQFLKGDIQDKVIVEENIDYIIHGASPTASKFFVEKPVDTIKSAVLGTINICELGVTKKIKSMVYLSSMEMYGTAYDFTQYASEKDLGYIDVLNVRSCYSEGKRMCENICTSYNSQYDLPVKIARLSQVFGAGISKNENRVFAQFAKSVIKKQDIVLHTNGESYGNYCYSSDAIKGILLTLIKGENANAYNVSNEETNMSIKEMAEMVASKIANNEIKVIFDIPEDSLDYGYAPATKLKLNTAKIKKLGFKPSYTLQHMYERLIAYIVNDNN